MLGICIDVAEPGDFPIHARVDAARPAAIHAYLTTLIVAFINNTAKLLRVNVNEFTVFAYDPSPKPIALPDDVSLTSVEFALIGDGVLRFALGLHADVIAATVSGTVAMDFRLGFEDGRLTTEFLGIDDRGLEVDVAWWAEVIAWLVNPFAVLVLGGPDEVAMTILDWLIKKEAKGLDPTTSLGNFPDVGSAVPVGLPIEIDALEARHGSPRLSMLATPVDQSLYVLEPDPQLDLELRGLLVGQPVILDQGSVTVPRGQTERTYEWTLRGHSFEFRITPTYTRVPEPRQPRWLFGGRVFETNTAEVVVQIDGVSCRFPTVEPANQLGRSHRVETRSVELRVSVDAAGKLRLRNRPEDGNYVLDVATEVALPAGYAGADIVTDTTKVEVQAAVLTDGGIALDRVNDLRAEIEHAVQTGRNIAELAQVFELFQNPEAALEAINSGGVGPIPRDLARIVQNLPLLERGNLRRGLRTLSNSARTPSIEIQPTVGRVPST